MEKPFVIDGRQFIAYGKKKMYKVSTQKDKSGLKRKTKHHLHIDEKLALVASNPKNEIMKAKFHVQLPIGTKVAYRVSKKQKECDDIENAYLKLEAKENKFAHKRNLKARSEAFEEENTEIS